MFGNDAENRLKKKSALIIQCAYRCHLARRTAKDRYRSQYRKVYDNDTKQYIYQNKKNLEIDIKLPKFFKKDALPSPRDLDAPMEYNPGNELNGDGCALIITNVIFPLGKWMAQAPQELENDHEQMVDLLTHEFIGRMRPENVIALKNPSCEDVRAAFKQLRQICRVDGFVTIYIATHIITITKSDKENPNENAYFAFKNSIWGKNNELVETCIAFADMIKMINKISCKSKNIFLNYGHHAPPRKVLFPASKLLYLPPNALQRLTDECNCPVIGCCTYGFNLREYLKYTPGIEFDPITSKSTSSKPLDNKIHPSPSIDSQTSLQDAASISSSVTSLNSLTPIPTKNNSSIYESEEWKNFMKEFSIPPIPEIYKTPKPEKPGPTWKQDKSTAFTIQIALPSEIDRQNYDRRVLFWKFRRTVAKPVNIFKSLNIQYSKYSLTSPEQISLIHKRNSIFGLSFLKAIAGGASSPDSNYISLKKLYLFMYQHMKSQLEKMNRNLKKKKEIEGDGGDKENHGETEGSLEGSLSPNGSVTGTGTGGGGGQGGGSITSGGGASLPGLINGLYQQNIVLFLPKKGKQKFEELLESPVLYRCAPPPAPERPYINEVKDDCVTIEWFNPVFQGIQPMKYKIFIRNNTRNFRKWQEVNYPGDITKTVFTIHNLPMGVSCEFKVSAYNSGGWSELSNETDSVIPGEDRTYVVPKRIKWRRLQNSGLIGILDYLDTHDYSYEDQEHGMSIILSFLVNSEESPLKSMKLATRLIDRIFYNFHFYPTNPIIIGRCFQIIGWCFKSKKLERKLRHYCLSKPPQIMVPAVIPTIVSTSSGMTTSSVGILEEIQNEQKESSTNPSTTPSSPTKAAAAAGATSTNQPKVTKNSGGTMGQGKIINKKNLFHYLDEYSERYFYHSEVMNAIQFLKQDELLKYFQNKEKQKEIEIMMKRKKHLKIDEKKNENNGKKDEEEGKKKEPPKINYLLNYSIPGRHEVIFPPDDSDDDQKEDSDDDDDDDEEEDEEEAEAAAKEEEEKKKAAAAEAEKNKKKDPKKATPVTPATTATAAGNKNAPVAGPAATGTNKAAAKSSTVAEGKSAPVVPVKAPPSALAGSATAVGEKKGNRKVVIVDAKDIED